MSLTLQQAFDLLEGLYGRRNNMHLSRNEAIRLISRARKRLNKDVRKDCPDPTHTVKLLASMLAHLHAYARTFGTLPIVEEWARKYPLIGCAYCGHKPCQCELGVRKEVTDYGIDPAQLTLTITQCVEHLDVLYGPNNRKRGLHKCLLRLFEEIDEAIEVDSFDFTDSRLSLDQKATLVAREFADAIAWTLVFVMLITVDPTGFEAAFLKMYGGVCGDCKQRPCQCGSVFSKRKPRALGESASSRSGDTANTTTE